MKYLMPLALLLCPSIASAQSILGVELGMSMAEAESTLMTRAGSVDQSGSQWSWTIRAEVKGAKVTVTAPKDSASSRAEAPVTDVHASAIAMDVTEESVARLYQQFKNRWTERFAPTEPRRDNGTATWSWQKGDIKAQILFTKISGRPHSVRLTLTRP
jgi:hypothetical protein